MFERFVRTSHALSRHRSGPLAEERGRYLAHCAEQQMSWETLRGIASYTLNVAEALHLDERPGEIITRAEIEAAADRWVHRHPRATSPWHDHRLAVRFTGHAIRWLAFLERFERPIVTQPPYADQLAQFLESLHRERGLSPLTIAYYQYALQKFLTQIHQADLLLETLTATQLDDLVSEKVREGRWSRVSLKHWATTLRPFLCYAENQGWCRPGLAAVIKTPRLFSQGNLPLGPTWDEVDRLLATVQGNRPAEIRDRALLLLLAVYGLRAAEIAALRLEDFDWEREILTISQGKGQRSRSYPLCHTVGEAILRYLREARPHTDRREVFLTVLAPFRPLFRKTIGTMVHRRLQALDLTLPHSGSHSLRHACATRLLEQGLSLKEIGDHLGHQSPDTTRIYAKVDLAKLRLVGEFSLEGVL